MNILITGAGSVMGQSIYKALAISNIEGLEIHFANSEYLGAGRFFNDKRAPIVQTPIFPLAMYDSYLEYLDAYVRKMGIDIVFTGTQHELVKICEYRDKNLNAATISSKIADICMDKIKTSKVLKSYGLSVPEAIQLERYLDQNQDLGEVVVKPNYSSSSRNIFLCKNKKEIFKALADNSLDASEFLVQNRLQGAEYTSGCYVDRFSKKIYTITFRRTLTPDGATSFGEIIDNPLFDGYVSNVAQALINEGMDFGHINVQFIDTEEGPTLFEINGRLSSTEASKAMYGFNSCAAFVANIVNNKEYTDWKISKKGKFLRYYEELYFD